MLIDVPIAKHHSLARLTLGGKNLLGTVADPNQIHQNLGQRIADLISLIRPTLTVVDAFRILMDHGPTGGSLDDVKQAQTVIASHDIVAADAYGSHPVRPDRRRYALRQSRRRRWAWARWTWHTIKVE